MSRFPLRVAEIGVDEPHLVTNSKGPPPMSQDLNDLATKLEELGGDENKRIANELRKLPADAKHPGQQWLIRRARLIVGGLAK